MEDASDQFLKFSRFWIQRVFVPILVCMGVSGNTVTVMVLTRKRMRCSTNIYLTALAVADVIYLLFVLLLSFQHYPNIHDRKYELYWRFFGITHWLCDAASSASIWLTVSFTVERYIAVCHPIKGKVFCTESRAKSIIFVVTMLCILTTASTTFEYQLTSDEYCIENCDMSDLKKTQQSLTGNNVHYNNSIVHYLPPHNILVTNLENNRRLDYSSAKLMNEVYSSLKPHINEILPVNCSSHPHIIYVPIFTSISNNKTDRNIKFNNHLIDIENQVNDKSDVVTDLLNSEDYNETSQESNIQLENLSIADKSELKQNVSENATCCLKKYSISTENTTLGSNKTYKTIMYWYSAIWFGLMPLVLIATFNCLLVKAVYKSQKRRRKMTNTPETISMSNENRITIMLIGVVILFLICQTPTASWLIYEYFDDSSSDPAIRNIKLALGNLFNFLVTINASCNFLLYCVLSKKYRTTFKILFCEARKNKQDSYLLSSTKSRNSQRFNPSIRRNCSEYSTPRNLETQSLTSIPRSKSLMARMPGKAKSTDFNI